MAAKFKFMRMLITAFESLGKRFHNFLNPSTDNTFKGSISKQLNLSCKGKVEREIKYDHKASYPEYNICKHM